MYAMPAPGPGSSPQARPMFHQMVMLQPGMAPASKCTLFEDVCAVLCEGQEGLCSLHAAAWDFAQHRNHIVHFFCSNPPVFVLCCCVVCVFRWPHAGASPCSSQPHGCLARPRQPSRG